jgi:SNF2 family DNA or RNA helicase
VNWLLQRRHGALFADPGTGKTLIMLTLLKRLRLLQGRLRVLLIAPIRVMHNVWPAEIEKWGFDFTTSIMHGRKRDKALHSDVDIQLINPEGLRWFNEQSFGNYDMLILDESSLFRNPTSQRMKILKGFLQGIKYRYILTGTPAPNSLQDLWSQMYIVDRGKTLGRFITHFRNAYFYKEVCGSFVKQHLIPGMDRVIWDRVTPHCYRIDADTCLDLPELIINDIIVDLPPAARKTYKDMEDKLFAEIDGENRFAATSGTNYGMCRQIAGGALYKEESREYDTLHAAKMQALDELRNELGGKPLLVIFHYRHELDRLQKHFKGKLPAIASGVKESKVTGFLDAWNHGELPVLAAQSQSISHGLNLQAGGNDIVWYTLTDDYDIYEQLNRRLYRSGVRGSVRIHRLIARGTVDHAVAGRLNSKRGAQQSLFDALQEYRCSIS